MPESKSPLLTPTQREALLNDYSDLDESQRSRLRSRVINIFEEFQILNNLPNEEQRKLFKKALGGDLNQNLKDQRDERDFLYFLDHLHMFLWNGLQMCGVNKKHYENIIETGIEMAESEGAPLSNIDVEFIIAEADVDIEIKRTHHPSIITSRKRFLNDENISSEELGRLVSSVPREELKELVEEHS